MKIVENELRYYLQRIARNQYFSFAGYSDAEWFCITGRRAGELTGFGQIMDPAHGKRLLDILKRRQNDQRFMVAVPKIITTISGFDSGEIDWLLGKHDITLAAYERDMVTDDLAAAGGLHPLVQAIRRTRGAVMIGNHTLEPMQDILRLRKFIGVDSPNLHMQPGGIEAAVRKTKQCGQPGIYLVSAGVSAAVIIDQLHDEIPNSFFIDCGSIWDAFCGIGGQRQWRADLYAKPEALEAWKRKCLYGQ